MNSVLVEQRSGAPRKIRNFYSFLAAHTEPATVDDILTHTFVLLLLLATILLPFCREMKRRCLWKCVRIVSKDLHIHTHTRIEHNQCHFNGIRPAVYNYI